MLEKTSDPNLLFIWIREAIIERGSLTKWITFRRGSYFIISSTCCMVNLIVLATTISAASHWRFRSVTHGNILVLWISPKHDCLLTNGSPGFVIIILLKQSGSAAHARVSFIFSRQVMLLTKYSAHSFLIRSEQFINLLCVVSSLIHILYAPLPL